MILWEPMEFFCAPFYSSGIVSYSVHVNHGYWQSIKDCSELVNCASNDATAHQTASSGYDTEMHLNMFECS